MFIDCIKAPNIYGYQNRTLILGITHKGNYSRTVLVPPGGRPGRACPNAGSYKLYIGLDGTI